MMLLALEITAATYPFSIAIIESVVYSLYKTIKGIR